MNDRVSTAIGLPLGDHMIANSRLIMMCRGSDADVAQQDAGKQVRPSSMNCGRVDNCQLDLK